jgi:hypothetical protein
MKPKLFIGSSSEAKDIANAIHSNLLNDAECTVWTNGVFGISEDQRESFKRQLDTSDFGAFVFSPDDRLTTRGNALNSTRDNVVYEAGLFAGRLGFSRCFVAIPLDDSIHLPTDLLGMTVGKYESKRADKNLVAAVNPFCSDVRGKLKALGYFQGPRQQKLIEYAVQYECCEWILDEKDRVSTKNRILSDMKDFCETTPVNKRELLVLHTLGAYAALASAICANPRREDYALFTEIKQPLIVTGNAQHRFLEAVYALKSKAELTDPEVGKLRRWLQQLPKPSDTFLERLKKL